MSVDLLDEDFDEGVSHVRHNRSGHPDFRYKLGAIVASCWEYVCRGKEGGNSCEQALFCDVSPRTNPEVDLISGFQKAQISQHEFTFDQSRTRMNADRELYD
jgi:hypothetical protein